MKKVNKEKYNLLSDHALIRYLERKYNLDTDAIRDEILTPKVVKAVESGALRLKRDGLIYCIKDKKITTIMKQK